MVILLIKEEYVINAFHCCNANCRHWQKVLLRKNGKTEALKYRPTNKPSATLKLRGFMKLNPGRNTFNVFLNELATCNAF